MFSEFYILQAWPFLGGHSQHYPPAWPVCLAQQFYDAVQRRRLPWGQAGRAKLTTTYPENPMADIYIDRVHTLGLHEARQIAFKWAEQAEAQFGMECTYEEGTASDLVSFSRTGVHGTLSVTDDGFELAAKLGFLLGAFKEKIEAEIVKNLDTLIASKAAVPKAAAKKAANRKKTA